MIKLVAGVVAVAVSLSAVAALAESPNSKLMATPSAADESVRNSVMAAAKAEPKSLPRNSMMATSGKSNGPAIVAQPSMAAARGMAPH